MQNTPSRQNICPEILVINKEVEKEIIDRYAYTFNNLVISGVYFLSVAGPGVISSGVSPPNSSDSDSDRWQICNA